jgi:hypothetical protein
MIYMLGYIARANCVTLIIIELVNVAESIILRV